MGLIGCRNLVGFPGRLGGIRLIGKIALNLCQAVEEAV
jgi:hypothetical protein